MEIFAPRTLEEALEVRSAHPGTVPVAGGTDFMVDVGAGRIRPRSVLDLSRVEELRTWWHLGAVVHVGAGMTFARIARELGEFPPLVQAARSVASVQIRNRATIGGNVATASPAGDSIPVLAAYGADVVCAGPHGRVRRVPWSAFLVGPKRNDLADDELIVGLEWRPVAGPGRFAKVGRRNAMVVAVASVCVQLDEAARHARVALGSVGPTVLRSPLAEAFAADGLDWERPGATLAEFGRLAAADAQPIDDVRGTAAFRHRAVEVLARRSLGQALEARC